MRMQPLLRHTAGAWAAISIAACAVSQGSASADSAGADSTRRTATAPMAPLATDTVPVATAGPDTAAPIGTRGAAPKEGGSIPSAGHAKSATGGARVTGGPERTPIPPRSSGCGGTFIVVTLTPAAVAGGGDATVALRQASSEVLAPVRDQVGSASLSPAVRAFRVSVKDPAAASGIVTRLRASPRVASATVDECAVRIERQ
jgi:hypothetical protein